MAIFSDVASACMSTMTASRPDAQRAGFELALQRLERIVQRLHHHPAHDVHHQHLAPVGGLVETRPPPRRAGRIIDRAQELRHPLDEHQRLALGKGMVAECDDIGAGIEEVVADLLGDAEAAGGVFAIHHDEIGRKVRLQVRQVAQERLAPGAPHHVAEEHQPHQPFPPIASTRRAPISVSIQSSG